jgi:hypothetical protein
MRQFHLSTFITFTSAVESIPNMFEIVLSQYNSRDSSWKVIYGVSDLADSTCELE